MIPRIIRDAARRLFWAWVLLLAVLTTIWVLALRPGFPPSLARFPYAFSFYVDLFVLIQLRGGSDSPLRLRLVQTLPIDRADLGAGVWLLAVMGPALVTTCAKVFAAAIVRATSTATPVDLSWVMFSGIFDLGYVGAMYWVLPFSVRLGLTAGVGHLITRVYTALGVIVFVYLGGALALARYIPIGWDEWRWHSGLLLAGLLAGLLALTAASRRQAIRLAASRAVSHTPAASAPPENAAGIVTGATRVPFDSRLSGVRRMLWLQFRNAAITSAITMSLLIVMGAAPYPRAQGFWQHIQDATSTLPAEIGALVWVLGWILSIQIGPQRWHPSRIPVLRTLPISARELNLLWLLRSVVTSLAFWLALLPIYLLSPAATHPWMGLGMLMGLIGATTLTNTTLLRWRQESLTTFVVIGVNCALTFGHPWTYVKPDVLSAGMTQVIALACGVCGIAAAAKWNQRLLTHSSPLYRRAR